jgi:hypothetical protein
VGRARRHHKKLSALKVAELRNAPELAWRRAHAKKP